jgi:hypothetical protein
MRVLMLSLLFGFGVAVSGCAKGDPAACKTTAGKDGQTCKKCCNDAGKSGYTWNGMSNECTCM